MGRTPLSCNSSLVNLSSSRAENNQNIGLGLCGAALNRARRRFAGITGARKHQSWAEHLVPERQGEEAEGKPKLIWNPTRPCGWEGAEIVKVPNQNWALCRESGDKEGAHCSCVTTNHNPTAPENRFSFCFCHLVRVKPFNNNMDAYLYIIVYIELCTWALGVPESLLHLWSLPLHPQVLVKPTQCIPHRWQTLCLGSNMEILVKSSFT